jgi:hypothetical protein
MYFFRTFKKSTAPYIVHNMGLRYIKNDTGYLQFSIIMAASKGKQCTSYVKKYGNSDHECPSAVRRRSNMTSSISDVTFI